MRKSSAIPIPKSMSLVSTLWLLMLVPLAVFGAGIYITWTLDQELVHRFRDLAQNNLQGTVILRKIANDVALARRAEKSFFIAVDSAGERARYRAVWQQRLDRATSTLRLAKIDNAGRFTPEELAQLHVLDDALKRYASGFKDLANSLESSSTDLQTQSINKKRSAADWNTLNRSNVDHLRPHGSLIESMVERRDAIYVEAVNSAEHTHRRGDTLVLTLHLLAIGLFISLILYAMRILRLAIETTAHVLEILGRGKLFQSDASDLDWDRELRALPRDFDAVKRGIQRVQRFVALQQSEKNA